jgi:hypothetical protein
MSDTNGNLIPLNYQFTTQEILQNVFSENAWGFHTYIMSDLDNDLDNDIVFATSAGLYWIENSGNNTYLSIHTINMNNTAYYFQDFKISDFDLDGDKDIIAIRANNSPILFESQILSGFPTFNSVYDILPNIPPWGNRKIQAIEIIDFDSDGDGDILYSVDVLNPTPLSMLSDPSSSFSIYINGGNLQFTKYLIDSVACSSFSPVDFDLDGDFDFVCGKENTIYTLINNGNNNYIKTNIFLSALGIKDVLADDLDNDGDIDIISASEQDNTIRWYENINPNSFIHHNIDINSNHIGSIQGLDYDLDGDIDIFTNSDKSFYNGYYISGYDQGMNPIYSFHPRSENPTIGICLYQNDGGGNFNQQIIGSHNSYGLYIFNSDTLNSLDLLTCSSASSSEPIKIESALEINSLCAGKYIFSITDSLNVIYDTVNINEPNEITFFNNDTICNGSSIVVGNSTYTTSGTYVDILSAANNCDSTVTTTLLVNSNTTSTDTHISCDSFTWTCDGNTYGTSNNTATYIYTNALGCDSTVTLNLTINNSTSSTDTHVACDEFMWYCDGNIYTASNNTATYTYTNAAGCDSIVTLDLTINNSTSNTSIVTACDAYVWTIDGNTYTTSGTYIYSSTNADGCDHIDTLDVTINNSTSNTSIVTACDTYVWAIDGNTYTTSGTYIYSSTNADGCDHTETLELTINNSTSNTTAVTTCGSYTWSLDGNTYTSSGTYADVSINASGCVHAETLELTINSVIASISQSGDSLFAVTTPIGLNANWYNIQTDNGETRMWLMEENTASFTPTFECSYFIVVSNDGCIDTSETYYYGANAARIGSFVTSPNPTSGLINVKFDNPNNQFVMFELISNNGSKLDEFITIENNLDIDLSKYPSGSYYFYFNSEDAVQGCRLEEVQKVSAKIILNK